MSHRGYLEPRKPKEATTAGRGVAADQVLKSHICVCCKKEERLNLFKQCSSCHAVRYCSLRCQKSHWKEHKPLCSAIKFLYAQNKKDGVTDSGMYVSHLTPRQHTTVTKLTLKLCETLEPKFRRPQRVRYPPRMFTYSSLGQPTISAVQASTSLAPGWYPTPISPTCLLYPCQHMYQPPYGS